VGSHKHTTTAARFPPCLHAYLYTKEDEEEAKEEEGGGVVVVMVLNEEAAREAPVAAPAAETTRGKRLLAAVRGKGIAVVALWLCVGWGREIQYVVLVHRNSRSEQSELGTTRLPIPFV